MGRFDINKIKGKEKDNGEINVVDSLLNSASQTLQTVLQKTEFIRYDDLIPNPRNKMSMEGIEELASLIELDGLQQPIVAMQQSDGKYRILGGERRYTAIGVLRERGKWNEADLVEVKLKDLEKVDIPLNEEDKEMFEILVTNQAREKTDADRAFEIKEWKNIISKLRKEGVNILVIGHDEEGNAIGKEIKGVKTQTIVAGQLGISPAQVAKFDKVENQGAEVLKQALYSNKISVANAADIASEPKKIQEKIINSILDTKSEIKKEDVEIELHKENKIDSGVKNVPEDSSVVITEEVFRADVDEILNNLIARNGVIITGKKYSSYLKKISELKKIIG